VTTVNAGWRTAAAAGTSAIIMIALGVPAAPVLVGAVLAFGYLRWRSGS
jgi:hypothetical protein